MNDLALDENGDIYTENGDLATVSDSYATAQFCRQRLKMIYGEYFLDKRDGVPYFQQILKAGADPSIIDSVFKRTILETNGVKQLLEFDMDWNRPGRKLTLYFIASCESGIIDFSKRKGGLTLP